MKGIPFLLIVLISVGAIYAWTINSSEGFAQYKSYSDMLKSRGLSIIDKEAVDVVEVNKAKKEGRPIPTPKAKPKTSPGLADAVNVANNQRVGSKVGTKAQDISSGAAPAAPYGVVSDTAPSLYTDPDNIVVTPANLKELRDNLRAFMQFELPHLRGQSDPTIQLPISSLKADYDRVDAEVAVLTRNPGQPSSLKGRQFKEIADNMQYLKDKYRRFKQNDVQGVVSPSLSPINNQNYITQKLADKATLADLKSAHTRLITERARLVANGSSDSAVNARVGDISKKIDELYNIIKRVDAQFLEESAIPFLKTDIDNILKSLTDTNKPLPSLTKPISLMPTGQPTVTQKVEERATLADLKSVRTRMIAERARLGAGGSLEPVINARIGAISKMIEDLNGIIQKVEARTLQESEIPVFKSDIDQLFKTLTDTSKPIPGLMRSTLPPEVANLLPPGMGQDAESQALIGRLADKYMGDFLKGVSVELGAKVKYTSENEARAGSFDRAFGPLATGYDRAIAQQSMLGTKYSGFPTDNVLDSLAASDQMVPKPVPGEVYDPYAYNPVEGQRRPSGKDPLPITGSASGFDWKTRAKQICENARKMGLNPADFGCMPDSATVSPHFSWRGYAKMICNRLQTHYYQGTDEACGCPPIGWPGWISAAGEAAQ